MEIKILGSGCRNCQSLEANTTRALAALGIDAAVGHVREEADIIAYGVMSTPALVIDERVVLAGRVPSAELVARLITDALAERGDIR